MFKQYFTDTVTNQVQLDIIYDTLKKTYDDKEHSLTNNNPMQIASFVKDSRSIADIEDSGVASNFQLDESYKNIDNILSIFTCKRHGMSTTIHAT